MRGISAPRHRGPRLCAACGRFDETNAEDPNRVPFEGTLQPEELLYARRMTERLDRFAPAASEALRLAARCQHIRRWMIPRGRFPAGRTGYRSWRGTLATYHADTAAVILDDVGYDDATVSRVRALLRKEGLKSDPDVQALEDVACLVFLEHYLVEFVTEHDESKIVNILRKTWRKMSDRGRASALQLDLTSGLRALVERAAALGQGA